jgi:hypothetical protein
MQNRAKVMKACRWEATVEGRKAVDKRHWNPGRNGRSCWGKLANRKKNKWGMKSEI